MRIGWDGRPQGTRGGARRVYFFGPCSSVCVAGLTLGGVAAVAGGEWAPDASIDFCSAGAA